MLYNNDNGRHRKYGVKPFSELSFTDDFMFRKVMYSNPDLCKRVIELLLDIKVDRINYKGQDYPITTTTDSKSVRLDVYVDDDDGTVVDLEMQNLSVKALPRRSRFYQAMVDVDNLLAGSEYYELPNSYIVFICTNFDPYERGFYKYEFRELCLQDTNIELGSGSSKVFINAKSKVDEMSEEMRAFLNYLCGKRATTDLTRDIDAGVANVKAYRPWEAEYMHWNEIVSLAEQDARRVGREEGREEGHAEGAEEERAVFSYLLNNDRIEDAKRVAVDPGFRAKILKEMGSQK